MRRSPEVEAQFIECLAPLAYDLDQTAFSVTLLLIMTYRDSKSWIVDVVLKVSPECGVWLHESDVGI